MKSTKGNIREILQSSENPIEKLKEILEQDKELRESFQEVLRRVALSWPKHDPNNTE